MEWLQFWTQFYHHTWCVSIWCFMCMCSTHVQPFFCTFCHLLPGPCKDIYVMNCLCRWQIKVPYIHFRISLSLRSCLKWISHLLTYRPPLQVIAYCCAIYGWLNINMVVSNDLYVLHWIYSTAAVLCRIWCWPSSIGAATTDDVRLYKITYCLMCSKLTLAKNVNLHHLCMSPKQNAYTTRGCHQHFASHRTASTKHAAASSKHPSRTNWLQLLHKPGNGRRNRLRNKRPSCTATNPRTQQPGVLTSTTGTAA